MAKDLQVDLDTLIAASERSENAGKEVLGVKGSTPLASVAYALPSGSSGEAAALAGPHMDAMAKRISVSLEAFSTALKNATGEYSAADENTSVDFDEFSTRISGKIE